MPEGLFLGPLLFTLFCGSITDCTQDENKFLADDTKLTCIGETVDKVANKNKVKDE